MGWERTIEEAQRERWERSDRYATLTIRKTAGGEWAVWIDLLQQAPDGPGYEHTVVAEEAAARERAAAWRERFDRDG